MRVATTGSALMLAMLAGCGKDPASPPPKAGPVITTGASVTVRTTMPLSSSTAKRGDIFAATLEEPLRKGDLVLAPKGAAVQGRIVDAGPGSRPRIAVELAVLQVAGRNLPISTNAIERGAKTDKAGAPAAAAVIPGESVIIFELKAPLTIPEPN